MIFESGDCIFIFWNDVKDFVLIEERVRWIEMYVCWFFKGIYLVIFY